MFCLWNNNSSPFRVPPGVRYLHGRVQGDSCLSGRRTTGCREGPSDRREHHQTVHLRQERFFTSLPTEAVVKRLCVCRMRRIFREVKLQDFSCVNAQVLGAEDMYGANARSEVTFTHAATHPRDQRHAMKVPILKEEERNDVGNGQIIKNGAAA